jgi:hypothetical protein
MEYTISVKLENKRGFEEKDVEPHDYCVCTHPVPGEPDYKVRVNPGDRVKWAFENKSLATVEVGVGNFQPPPRYSGRRNADGEGDPFEKECKRTLTLEPKQSGVLECRIKSKFDTDLKKESVTWKYDIIRYQDGYEWVLLDPELEIPNRNVGP